MSPGKGPLVPQVPRRSQWRSRDFCPSLDLGLFLQSQPTLSLQPHWVQGQLLPALSSLCEKWGLDSICGEVCFLLTPLWNKLPLV
jgi:hypothetical protein